MLSQADAISFFTFLVQEYETSNNPAELSKVESELKELTDQYFSGGNTMDSAEANTYPARSTSLSSAGERMEVSLDTCDSSATVDNNDVSSIFLSRCKEWYVEHQWYT